jgi:hypothetical protein
VTPARDPKFRSYRVTLYALYGAFCAVLFAQLLRSVASDIYGHPPPAAPQASPTACLEDVDRLYSQLAARAVQPAPGGLEGGALAREWDLWTRRWEADVARVSSRCELDDAKDPARRQLAAAVDALEDLRRDLALSGESTAGQARQVRDALAQARQLLGLKPK